MPKPKQGFFVFDPEWARLKRKHLLKDNWYELYQGEAKKIGKHGPIRPKPIITSSQGLFHRDFPDGKKRSPCRATVFHWP